MLAELEKTNFGLGSDHRVGIIFVYFAEEEKGQV